MPGSSLKRIDPLLHAIQTLTAESAEIVDMMRANRINKLDLLNRKFDQDYDDCLLIACQCFDMPDIAQINLIDETRQWTKAQKGLVCPLSGPRDEAICSIAIQTPDDLLVIEDGKLDPRVCGNPKVKAGVVSFYAGAPLVTPDGIALGAVCVAHSTPASITDKQRVVLAALARIITTRMLTIQRLS